jgi:DNA-binding response OmpR family regulator
MLSRRLARHGFFVATAEHGQSAIELLSVERFDLILLDLMMPVMNGYDALEWIKSQPICDNTKVIVLTASDDRDSVVACLTLGANDYCLKPFNMAELKRRINRCLEDKNTLARITENANFTDINDSLVLVADSNELSRDILCHRIEAAGFRFIVAPNGESVLEYINRQSIDVILLDTKIPGLSGYEVLRELKASAKHDYIPVIMMSDVATREERDRYFSLGAGDFISKPFNSIELVFQIRQSTLDKKMRDQNSSREQRYLELQEIGKNARSTK